MEENYKNVLLIQTNKIHPIIHEIFFHNGGVIVVACRNLFIASLPVPIGHISLGFDWIRDWDWV